MHLPVLKQTEHTPDRASKHPAAIYQRIPEHRVTSAVFHEPVEFIAFQSQVVFAQNIIAVEGNGSADFLRPLRCKGCDPLHCLPTTGDSATSILIRITNRFQATTLPAIPALEKLRRQCPVSLRSAKMQPQFLVRRGHELDAPAENFWSG